MKKSPILAALAAIASTPGIFMASPSMAGLRFRKPSQGEVMLWPASNGTYVRAKHGELKDENGNPRYA